MATVTAFKGLAYNPEKIKDFGDVCTPPYDIISKEEQEGFYARHPNNIIRLILGKAETSDSETVNAHSRAAGYFSDWISQKILVKDEKPAIYFTAVDFTDNKGNAVTRFGLIARVGLEPFEKGIILPHEKTFSKVKTERLNLMKACHANFSPIFSLYSDPQNHVIHLLKENSRGKAPDIDFIDSKGLRQKMWRITEPNVTDSITRIMSDKVLYIADGHHRYETALNYRNWASENRPDFSEAHSANYIMMYLSSMDEPGLTIFPTHRLVLGLTDRQTSDFLDRAKAWFDVDSFPFVSKNRKADASDLVLRLESASSQKAIGVCMKDNPEFHVLKIKPGVMERLFSNELPSALRDLDVTILTRLILMEILQFDNAMLDNDKMIRYTSDAGVAIAAPFETECKMAFILNPTRIEQVKQVAQEGLIMPRKSTYFYPKVITGQVIHKLD